MENIDTSTFIDDFVAASEVFGLDKEAALDELNSIPNENAAPDLNDKERRVLSKLQNSPGLVLAHGLGTGKTRTSIQAANALGQSTDVVVPAALQDNYKKEMNKWNPANPQDFNIMSQQATARGMKPLNGDTLVVDEAHRARDPGSSLLKALKQSQASKRLLLTATPVYNHPSDIAPLVNLAANQRILPEDPAKFSQRYVGSEPVSAGLMGGLFGIKPGSREVLKNTNELGRVMKKYVDYESGSRAEGFPTSKEEVINVPMTGGQQDIYKTIMGKAPFWMRWKVNAGLPPGKGELMKLQAFLTGARQVANSDWDFVQDKKNFAAPKAEAAAKFLHKQIQQNPNYKGVAYSNYINSGLNPYKEYLKKFNIPYGEFSGEMAPAVRNQMVKDYNANKLKALLISSAGAEGLDLKGTRVLQILEPHFNREKEKQIIGRAIRYQSHAGLAPEEQNVTVQRYLARPEAGFLNRMFGKQTVRGTDQYISDIADRKEQLNQQLMALIAKNSA